MLSYGSGRYCISKPAWDELNAFFVSIEPPAQDELYASGDRYTLWLNLRKLGFQPPTDAFALYRFAEDELLLSWEGQDDGDSNTANAKPCARG